MSKVLKPLSFVLCLLSSRGEGQRTEDKRQRLEDFGLWDFGPVGRSPRDRRQRARCPLSQLRARRPPPRHRARRPPPRYWALAERATAGGATLVAARCGKAASALHEPGEQSSGLEGIDGHDAAIELPVIQVFCENGIAAKSFGGGDDLRIVVLNAVDSLYLDRTGDKRIVNG